MRTSLRILVILAGLALLTVSSQAQTVTGKLEGHATDSAGAVVPNVKVVARNLETAYERSTVSNSEGYFEITFLPPGSYAVKAELQGFKTIEKRPVSIELNKTTVSDFVLEISAVKEVVTVTGEAPQIETTTGEVKGSMDERTVENTPLSGRNFLSLMELVPEFNLAPGWSGVNNPTLSTGSFASFNGTGSRSTTFQTDGVNNDDSSENQSRQGVNISAIKAVQVVTNSYSAEFGRGAGGVVLVQTKGGTNAFHGDAYEYLQNEKLAANSFFGNAAGRRADGSLISPVSPTKRNQFGYTVGGPILKDRVFFFHSFEQTRFRQSAVITRDIFLPTEKLQTGTCDLCLNPAQHPNLNADLQFLQGILDRFPKAAPNNPSAGPRAYTAQAHNDFPDQDYSGRFDVKLREQDSLVMRYQYSRQHRHPGEIVVGDGASQNNKQQNVGATYTHIFSTTTVGEFRFGLGLRTTLVDISSGNATPVIRFAGTLNASTIGNAGAFPINRRQNDYQYVYNLSRVGRKHTLRVGTDLRRQHLDDISDNFSRGFWNFGSTPASGTTPAYDAYGNFLRGLITSFQKGYGLFYLQNRMGEMNYFLQDDLRLRPNLTLNLGARYEYVAAPSDVKDRIKYGYGADSNNVEPRFGFAWAPGSKSGWLARLVGGPGKTSLRGGYGIFHGRIFQSLFSQGGANLRTQPPVGVLKSYTNSFDIADPSGGFVFTPGIPPGRISILQVDPGFHMPYTQQANLTIERQLPGKLAVGLGYRWVRGLGLPFYRWTNRARFPIVSPVDGVLYDKIDPNLANANPAPGFISITQPRTDLRRPDVRYTNLLIASNEAWSYYNAFTLTVNKRFSHGLSFNSYYTFSRSIDTGSEATSSGIDANAAVSEFDSARSLRSLGSFHTKHRYVFNWNYQIPGSRLLNGIRDQAAGRALDYVIGGWNLSGTYTAASGQPFSVLSGYDYNADGLGFDRPILLDNSLLGRSVDNARVDPATGLQFAQELLPAAKFFPNLVANPSNTTRPFAPGTAGEGSIGRNVFFLQGMNNVDLALHKSFRVRENQNLIFRAEFYNLMNRVQFGVPSQTVLTTTFARISGQRNPTNFVGASRLGSGQRFIQMALRYTF